MNKSLSLRQLLYTYIFIMIAPILRSLPNNVCKIAGSAGWISVILGLIFGIIGCICIWLFIRCFPACNFYEIIEKITSKPIAKIIISLYLFWAIINVFCKLPFYSLNYQTTLMTYSTNEFLLSVLMVLVGYALLKGVKTFFRLSELVLIIFLIVISLLVIIASSKFRLINLTPRTSIGNVFVASSQSFSTIGYILMPIFFADRLDRHYTKFSSYFKAFAALSIICITISVTTIGTNGSELTSSLTFPFYTAVKRTSFLDILERLEEFVILPSALSDFVFICVFCAIIFLCLKWLFNLNNMKIYGIPILLNLYFIGLMFIKTQFEAESFYSHIFIYFDFLFLYIIPLILLIIAAVRGQLKSVSKNDESMVCNL